MIVFRFLLIEVLKSTLAVFSVLMVVFISRELVSILADASEGKIAGAILFQLLSLNVPALATMVLPLGLFLGILIALGRMYVQSEMVVLQATGVSEWYVTRVTLILAAVITVVTAFLTVYLVPVSKERELQLLEQAEADTNVQALVEGRFRQSKDGKTVIFVEEISKRGNQLDKVFVAQMPENWNANERGSLVLAEKGVLKEQDDGSVNLELSKGERYEGAPSQQDYNRITFDTYTIDAKAQVSERKRRKLDAVATSDLFNSDDPDYIAELHWRIALPLAIPILTLLAVPLSVVNPRQGAFAKMLPAILLYLAYFILLMAGRKALQSGAVPSWLGLWWVHCIGLSVAVGLLISGRKSGARIKSKLMMWRRN
ncbi:LPS export ABC transporter permease LptF [Neiella marina]|uniref:Lipopolysaccharide export system permease protein LptF n=1 Tax=Neiella holothuriorum TaxID=2870530 RepID=A0ABS7EKW0_9GAMM|nr:LPS export ABC transporter permease LptF [Neiella holothuriorum]MBW8192845.1 LPS export ABC transporter permease LptF [Neiella holothuriorum]